MTFVATAPVGRSTYRYRLEASVERREVACEVDRNCPTDHVIDRQVIVGGVVFRRRMPPCPMCPSKPRLARPLPGDGPPRGVAGVVRAGEQPTAEQLFDWLPDRWGLNQTRDRRTPTGPSG